jgi:hypothetical protein
MEAVKFIVTQVVYAVAITGALIGTWVTFVLIYNAH